MPGAGPPLTPESVLEGSAEGIVVLDRAGRVVFANATAAGLLGFTAEQLVGESLHALTHHHRADGAAFAEADCPISAVAATQVSVSSDADTFWRSSGTPVTVRYRATPVFRGGGVDGVVVTFAHTTLVGGEHSAAVFRDAAVGMAVVDVSGTLLQVNDALAGFLAADVDALIGTPLLDVVAPDDRTGVADVLARLGDGNEPAARHQHRFLRADGGVVHVLLHATLVRDGDGRPLHVFCQLADVTEQWRAEEMLRRDAERAAKLVALQDALVDVGADLGVLTRLAAEAVSRLLGDTASLWLLGPDGVLDSVTNAHPDPAAVDLLDGIFDRLTPQQRGALGMAVVGARGPTFEPDGRAADGDTLLGLFRPFTDVYGLGSVIAVPISVRGRTTGLLSLSRDAGHAPYTDDDFALAKDVAQRIGLALDNASLYQLARAAEDAVRASEERYRALVQQSADVIMVLDADGRIRYATPSAYDVFDADPAAGRLTLADLLHPEDAVRVADAFTSLVEGGDVAEVLEFRVRSAEGGWRHVEARGRNLLDHPAVDGVVVNVRDVTERRRVAEQQAAVAALGQWALAGTPLPELLEATASLVARTLDLPLCAVFELLPDDGHFRLVAGVGWAQALVGARIVPAFPEWVSDLQAGRTAPVVTGPVDERFFCAPLLREHDAVCGASATIEGQAGTFGVLSVFATEEHVFTAGDRNFLVAVANVVAAVVERRRAEEEVRHQALHDSLTGLPNRTLLADRVEQALAGALRDGTHVGLLLLDLDGFKDVNDSLGHHAGDQLLRLVAERLVGELRGSDTVARLGGDEFAVCLPDLHSAAEASAIAVKLLSVLERPFELAEMAVTLSASLGVALSGEHGHEPSLLLQRADIAMYRAKRARCGWALYDTATDEAHRHRLAVLAELRDAADLGELELHYQPLIDLRTGEVEHVEALVRWSHPVRGLIPPGDFIPLAEQSGLIHPLTSWVLAEAVEQARLWEKAGRALPIAVNLSAVVLQDPNLPGDIAGLLADAGLPTDRLIVEITESVIADEGVREALQRLAEAGMTLAIDDFGTGYSSLAWLRTLPVHQLKIDRAFVTHMVGDPKDTAIVRSVVQLAHSLGLTVIAEGVETDDVAAHLATLDADVGQGYLFSFPLPPAELERWLVEHRPRAVVRSGTIVA